MENNKYSVGDRVLVEAEVTHACESGNAWVVITSAEGNTTLLLSDNRIYGLAPEFRLGEELEFSNDKNFEIYRTGKLKSVVVGDGSQRIKYEMDGLYFTYPCARRPQKSEANKAPEFVTFGNGDVYKLVKE